MVEISKILGPLPVTVEQYMIKWKSMKWNVSQSNIVDLWAFLHQTMQWCLDVKQLKKQNEMNFCIIRSTYDFE